MTTRSEQAKTVMKWAKSIAMPKMPKKTGDKWNEKKNNIQRKMKEKKGNRKGPRKKKKQMRTQPNQNCDETWAKYRNE